MLTVLVAVDGSTLALDAARRGLAVLRADRDVVVATVIEAADPTLAYGVSGMAGPEMTVDEWNQLNDAVHEAGAGIAAAAVDALGVTGAQTRVLEGAVGPRLCDLATEVGADVIVIGTRGKGGVARAVLGSASDHVVRNASCAVLVSRDGEAVGAGPVIVGTDGSESAIRAAQAGVALVDPAGSIIVATAVEHVRSPLAYDGSHDEHAVESDDERDARRGERDDAAEQVLEETTTALGRTDISTRIVEGDPEDALCALAAEVDARLVVVGSRGRSGVTRAVLGSVSDRVVRNAPCPVLVDR